MQGSIFCHGHNPQAIKSGGAPEGNANALVHGLYSKFLTSEEQQALMLNQEIPGLDGEIQAARVALMRALRGGTTDEIIRASQAVGRLMEMARRLAGEQAEGIVSALSTLLSELGVGENSGSGQEAV